MSTPEPGVSNETVVGTYDRLAVLYDRLVAPLESGTRERAFDLLGLDGGERVVEVGCGPGRAAVALAGHAGQAGRVVAVDAAPGMLARARRRIARTGVDDRTALVLGDARSLPLGDGVADVAFVEDTLELFAADELPGVVGELRRVLRADGRLCVVTMERSGAEDDPFVRAYDWAFEHVPGYDRVGCRPVYARRALETGGFDVERRERHRRAGVWPVDVLVARPA